jgi:transcriptional regulator
MKSDQELIDMLNKAQQNIARAMQNLEHAKNTLEKCGNKYV